MSAIPHIRVARPVLDLQRAVDQYKRGLNLTVLYEFHDHSSFSGAMLGYPSAAWHLEFTVAPTSPSGSFSNTAAPQPSHESHSHAVGPNPTVEDLLVLYLPDPAEFEARYQAMSAAGFREVPASNPYWTEKGAKTCEDAERYRVVLMPSEWKNETVLENWQAEQAKSG